MPGNLIERFQKHLEAQNRYSPNTIINYCNAAKHMEDTLISSHGLRFDETEAGKIKGYMLDSWIEYMSHLKPSTRAQYSVCSRIFLRFIYQSGFTETDLSSSVPKMQSVEKKYGKSVEEELDSEEEEIDNVVYTDEEIDQLLNCAPNAPNNLRDRAIIMLLKGCGLRASELASLTVRPFVVSYKGYVNCMAKGGIIQKVPIPTSVYEAVLTYLNKRFNGNIPADKNIPLFVSNRGNPMNRFSIYEALRTRQEKCNLHTGVHRMRHTFTTNVEKRYSAAAARDMARHKSLKITNRYVHTTIQERMKMAEEMQNG